ncbi:ArsR/SmtB family transcription factor [Mucilaginibacter sp.]|jgi:rhodanese-related sulfurtransferase|uniref:ArsR/SmtB family transcription factor n=1 Tax=Mucilaginibacter sp. TaxID=1882438 RepID=UPI0035691FBE
MEKRAYKDTVFAELARISGALSNPRRLEIVDLLAQGEKTVEKIALETCMSVANTSQHLQVLKAGSLVEIKKQGNHIYYRLSSDKVAEIWKLMRDFGTSRIAEINRVVKDFREQKQILESVTIDELIDKMEGGHVVLLDVRPEEEYLSGHIARSISIPVEQLLDRMAELPPDKTIIAYCRGPFCVFADDAVALLKEHNYNAVRLEEGFPDWKLKGLPVEMNA